MGALFIVYFISVPPAFFLPLAYYHRFFCPPALFPASASSLCFPLLASASSFCFPLLLPASFSCFCLLLPPSISCLCFLPLFPAPASSLCFLSLFLASASCPCFLSLFPVPASCYVSGFRELSYYISCASGFPWKI